MTRSRCTRRLFSAFLASLALVLLAGCGGSSSTTGSSATPSVATSSDTASATTEAAGDSCADVAALKSSLQSLASVKPLRDGLTALNSAVADTKTALDTAVSSASAKLRPAIEQVKTQFAAVQTAAEGLTKDNIRQQAPALVVALQGLGTATTALATSVTESCPGS